MLEQLKSNLEGELHYDKLTQALYATDASVYRKRPLAVAYPKTDSDIQKLIRFAASHKVGLIPRAGGTSLAGQCVGEGVVVDVSRYMKHIQSVKTECLFNDNEFKQFIDNPGPNELKSRYNFGKCDKNCKKQLNSIRNKKTNYS